MLEQLERLLDAERDALSQRAPDQIQENTDRKQAALEQYLELNRARTDLLQRLGYEATGEGVAQLISTAPAAAQLILTASWEKLQQKLKSLQDKNQINGQITSRGLKNIEQLLSIISGRHTKDRLYNDKGSAGHYRAQSRIGKA